MLGNVLFFVSFSFYFELDLGASFRFLWKEVKGSGMQRRRAGTTCCSQHYQ